LHQITTRSRSPYLIDDCFSSQICIKSQLGDKILGVEFTVSHLKFASNHNFAEDAAAGIELFLISNLHQITTMDLSGQVTRNCFSSQICIKSQLHGVISCFVPTVSHLKFASNHNKRTATINHVLLFLISNLHQITTPHLYPATAHPLFLISNLHQITTD